MPSAGTRGTRGPTGGQFAPVALRDGSRRVSLPKVNPPSQPFGSTRRAGLLHSQTKLFRSVVRDHMGPKPVEVARTASIGETVNGLAQAGSRMAVVMDTAGRPVGILTEQDVVRRVAWRVTPDQPVEEVMTAPIITISTDDHLLDAITTMRRHR